MISYNFLSIWTLFKKEVYRFLKVGIQTVIGPAISSLLFLAIFTLALVEQLTQSTACLLQSLLHQVL